MFLKFRFAARGNCFDAGASCPNRKRIDMSGRSRALRALPAAMAALLFLASPARAVAEEMTVTGRITVLDPDRQTFTVMDATGTGWNYKVAKDAGINLREFKAGDRVTVTISRATPRNMMSSADILRKGDRVVYAGGY